MKRLLLILIILLVFTTVFLSACTNETTYSSTSPSETPTSIKATTTTTTTTGTTATAAPTTMTTVLPTPTSTTGKYVVGNTIKFGEYDWQILDVFEGKALLITSDIVALKFTNENKQEIDKYNSIISNKLSFYDLEDFAKDWDEISDKAYKIGSSSNLPENGFFSSWDKSTLRAWLNSEIRFSQDEMSKIVDTLIVDKLKLGADTTDKVFILDEDDVVKYFPRKDDRSARGNVVPDESILYALRFGALCGNLSENGSKKLLAMQNGDKYYWWVRNAGSGVFSSGDIYDDLAFLPMDSYTGDMAPHPMKLLGVRPAIWIKIDE